MPQGEASVASPAEAPAGSAQQWPEVKQRDLEDARPQPLSPPSTKPSRRRLPASLSRQKYFPTYPVQIHKIAALRCSVWEVSSPRNSNQSKLAFFVLPAKQPAGNPCVCFPSTYCKSSPSSLLRPSSLSHRRPAAEVCAHEEALCAPQPCQLRLLWYLHN